MKKIPLHLYTLSGAPTREAYDEAALAACLQGLYNRENGPGVYLLTPPKTRETPLPPAPMPGQSRPRYWLDKFTAPGQWLAGREHVTHGSIGALCALARPWVKKAVIWDEDVDASFNTAFTIAGVEDGVVLSPGYAEKILPLFSGVEVVDLRGKFTGAVSGSRKNDAHLWAIENYLAKGLCSKHWLCLYSDPFRAREKGEVGYVVTRDWCVCNRAFVFDLSPWGDEVPLDDPGQPLGRDLETYHVMLAEQLRQTEGKQMTEVAGFFNFQKYSKVEGHEECAHEPVPTEWESVHIMSAYNCYQNTVAQECFNQSLHAQFPFKPLKQARPPSIGEVENAVYLGIQMCDYDSTTPLYDFLPNHWDDPARGTLALSWGINPNLIETYPDIISYLYETAAPNQDVFVADASAAGYFNPSRIQPRHWDMVVAHNRRFFNLTDMTMAPMVLDWEPPTPEILDQLVKFAPDGIAFICHWFHRLHLKERCAAWTQISTHRGVVVDKMFNGVCDGAPPDQAAARIRDHLLKDDVPGKPAFHYIRVVWQSPSYILEMLAEIKRLRPDLDIRLVNTHAYFRLYKRFLEETP